MKRKEKLEKIVQEAHEKAKKHLDSQQSLPSALVPASYRLTLICWQTREKTSRPTRQSISGRPSISRRR